MTHAKMVLGFVGILTLLLGSVAGAQTELGTAFTYQGQLQENGLPVDGVFDLEFMLYDKPNPDPDPLIDPPVGTVTLDDVAVFGGLFTVQLDFGSAAFDGEARWLRIGVREGDPPDVFVPLAPLQPLTAAPYALFALNSAGGGIPAGTIVMWFGPLDAVPDGWAPCDGGIHGGVQTPDLRNRFILGTTDGEDPSLAEIVGGSSSHSHSMANAGSHIHSGTTEGSNNDFTVDAPDGGDTRESVPVPHTHDFETRSNGGHTHSLGSSGHLPPYAKLSFIMKLP